MAGNSVSVRIYRKRKLREDEESESAPLQGHERCVNVRLAQTVTVRDCAHSIACE